MHQQVVDVLQFVDVALQRVLLVSRLSVQTKKETHDRSVDVGTPPRPETFAGVFRVCTLHPRVLDQLKSSVIAFTHLVLTTLDPIDVENEWFRGRARLKLYYLAQIVLYCVHWC